MMLTIFIGSQIVRASVSALECLRLWSWRVERVRLHGQLNRLARQLCLDRWLDHEVWRRLLAVHFSVGIEQLILWCESMLMLLDVAQYVRLLDRCQLTSRSTATQEWCLLLMLQLKRKIFVRKVIETKTFNEIHEVHLNAIELIISMMLKNNRNWLQVQSPLMQIESNDMNQVETVKLILHPMPDVSTCASIVLNDGTQDAINNNGFRIQLNHDRKHFMCQCNFNCIVSIEAIWSMMNCKYARNEPLELIFFNTSRAISVTFNKKRKEENSAIHLRSV